MLYCTAFSRLVEVSRHRKYPLYAYSVCKSEIEFVREMLSHIHNEAVQQIPKCGTKGEIGLELRGVLHPLPETRSLLLVDAVRSIAA